MDRTASSFLETIMVLSEGCDGVVQRCKNPAEVSCQHLNIDLIPKSIPPSIKSLDLSYNFIQHLSNETISLLHYLQTFRISHNHLETIEKGAFKGLTQLHSLDLAANHLYKHYVFHKGIFEPLKSLKSLSLASNGLDYDMATFYLTNTTSLEKLDLSGNKMVTVSSGMFDHVVQLSELDLSNNYIMEIERGTFDSLKHLRILNLAQNSIPCISGFDLSQLRYLNLSFNALRFFLANDSQKSYRLRNLDLSHNHLLHFPVLPKFHAIQHINVSGNNIAALRSFVNMALEDSEKMFWFEEFAEVDLSSIVQNTASSLLEISSMDLSWNQLTSFPINFLSNMSTLRDLNMADNCLGTMAEESSSGVSNDVNSWEEMGMQMPSMRTLDLQRNSIHSLPDWLFTFMPMIEEISLQNNNIYFCSNPIAKTEKPVSQPVMCTSFSGAHHLRYLNLRSNSIQYLPPYVFHQTSLVLLDLSHNVGLEIQQGALAGLEHSLQILSLSGNQMNDLQAKLPCLKLLKSVDLSYNGLTDVPPNLYCSQVRSLDLRNNVLSMIDEKIGSVWAESLRYLYVGNNPFNCCSLTWLEKLQNSHVDIVDLDDTHCILSSNNDIARTNISSDHTTHCPRGVAKCCSVAMTVVIITLVALSFCFVMSTIIKKSGPKIHIQCKFRSNKVAFETTKSGKIDVPTGFAST
ncbi:transforming growth factor beta activator LRRC32-like [Pelodytes ibericus]